VGAAEATGPSPELIDMRRRVHVLIDVLLVGSIVGLVGRINQSYLKDQWNWFTTIRPYMLANFRPFLLTPEAERKLKPRASFRECAKDCPEMILIPAGEFTMGSPVTEEGRYANEGSRHKVTIARPFAVSKFDVTFADWDACVSVGGCPRVGDSNFGRGTRPVINVNWNDAQQYVAWLSKMTGEPYHLLTEAEWEYAARAGATTAYYWGDESGVGNANCNGCGSEWDGRETSPVGSFKPNALASTTWRAMWCNGCRIAIIVATTERRQTVQPGPAEIAVPVSSAAGPGTTIRRSSAPPTATGTSPTSGTTLWASGLGGR